MTHSFDVELAKKFGIEGAVIIQHFQFWIVKNKANGRHYYEGRTWTYCSVKALAELFPYMTRKKIYRVINKLIDADVLVKGNFNKSSYNRTTWYAFRAESLYLPDFPKRENGFPQKGKWISPKGKMDFPKRENQYIYNNIYNKKYIEIKKVLNAKKDCPLLLEVIKNNPEIDLLERAKNYVRFAENRGIEVFAKSAWRFDWGKPTTLPIEYLNKLKDD